MAFPACAGLGLHWFMWQSRVILSIWKGLFYYIYQGGQGSSLETQKAQCTSFTRQLSSLWPSVTVAWDRTLDLTRTSSSVSVVVCFSCVEVSVCVGWRTPVDRRTWDMCHSSWVSLSSWTSVETNNISASFRCYRRFYFSHSLESGFMQVQCFVKKCHTHVTTRLCIHF